MVKTSIGAIAVAALGAVAFAQQSGNMPMKQGSDMPMKQSGTSMPAKPAMTLQQKIAIFLCPADKMQPVGAGYGLPVFGPVNYGACTGSGSPARIARARPPSQARAPAAISHQAE